MLLALLLAAATPPAPGPELDPLPPALRTMLTAAIASNNDGEIVTVAKYARAALLDAAAAIDASVAAWREAQAARQA